MPQLLSGFASPRRLSASARSLRRHVVGPDGQCRECSRLWRRRREAAQAGLAGAGRQRRTTRRVGLRRAYTCAEPTRSEPMTSASPRRRPSTAVLHVAATEDWLPGAAAAAHTGGLHGRTAAPHCRGSGGAVCSGGCRCQGGAATGGRDRRHLGGRSGAYGAGALSRRKSGHRRGLPALAQAALGATPAELARHEQEYRRIAYRRMLCSASGPSFSEPAPPANWKCARTTRVRRLPCGVAGGRPPRGRLLHRRLLLRGRRPPPWHRRWRRLEL